MKNILKVTILFCIIIACFAIPAFAFSPLSFEKYYYSPNADRYYVYIGAETSDPVDETIYYFYVEGQNQRFYFISKNSGNFTLSAQAKSIQSQNANLTLSNLSNIGGSDTLAYDDSIRYNSKVFGYNFNFTHITEGNIPPMYSSLDEALEDFYDTYVNPQPVYSKNTNVDEFIANTLISMGVKFDTPADALSYASDAWDWCIDETNRDDANAFDEWNIDAFVSYCNAQSNNYLNWYNGYKVSADVTKALGVYIRSNIQLLTGLPSGVSSLTVSYLPIGHFGSGFNSGATNPSAQTFYPAQTITYFNGEYLNEPNDISTSQFLYTPPDVRRFLGYPGSSPTITPSSPTGTGTITDDPNNPDQKNISINFPALDWLADAIKSILDFLREAFTTLASLLTQLLDAILGLFSDAFDGLTDFGEGFIEFLQTVFTGFSDVLSGFVPTDIATILVTFLALNIGLGLIIFVLKGH